MMVSGHAFSAGRQLVLVIDSLIHPELRCVILLTNKVYSFNMCIFQVRFVTDNDPSYGDNQNRAAMISQGKISFRTCFQTVAIPASHVLFLASSAYPSSGSEHEPACFRDAFDHWMLCEILGAIGGHTMM
jgi:hypothetical protein